MESPKKPSSLQQKTVKGLIWSALDSWGRQVISLGVFFILARLLGPEAFGLVALSSVFLAFLQVFLDQGFSTAIVQRQKLDAEHLDTAFWITLGISLILTVSSVACAGLAADLFHQPQLVPIIRCLSIGFIFSGLNSVQQAILQRQFAFKSLAIRSLIAVLVGGTVGVVMAFLNFGVWSIVGQQLSNSFVQVLVLWRVSNWRPGLRFSTIHAKELFSFGIHVSGFNILNFFNRRSDDLLIGYFLGPIALGYYSVAYRILLVMTEVLISTTTKVTIPIFSRLQAEPERLIKAFYKATQFAGLIAFPMFIIVPVLAPELVKILFGDQWNQSVPVMQILSLIGPIHLIIFYNSSVLTALGKPSWRLGIHVINTVTNVIGFALVVQWGIVAVASFYVIRSYLLSPISLLAINKLVNINIIKYLNLYVVPLIASVIMVATMLSIKYLAIQLIDIRLLTAILVLLGILTYVLAISLISPSLLAEIVDLAKSVKLKVAEKS
ncbi:lipopolysaccharide biosynthesis protein [Nostocaceae cyanobacterium CENA357]|uniref:Lipopolysaccharide biosynthesis protein n=1 Tax=Atlanticothrix silvestris CENA357 TaxID=1725252 RepID=A0A8J7KVC3_9CYAN|nr:lipopolysaccharide biosynthesis protein [Atlanticothrix silvestris]MBH8551090.1 lipopolysaccharide biosynthesis protein [Atlanticothrix silvestris CENA357]